MGDGMKYNNRKTYIDGILFDSKAESDRYLHLRRLERDKKITDLRLQVEYELQPAFKVGRKKVRPITYIADFVYTANGEEVVEDVKGKRTDVYMIKRKLFAYRYQKEITEV